MSHARSTTPAAVLEESEEQPLPLQDKSNFSEGHPDGAASLNDCGDKTVNNDAQSTQFKHSANTPTGHTGHGTDNAIYDKFPLYHKHIITVVVSFCGFLAPISSTSILAAIPEVAATYNTTGTTINISNALYMLFMGLSPLFWGPIGGVWGRRLSLASSSLIWNMYSLLTPIRYVLNPRFHLTSPLQSGLFYIAPGCGYLLGTFFGGRWADYIVRKWIRKRDGERVPEDRLRACVPFLGVVLPCCMLIYGWSIEKEKGGIALPVVFMFLQGVAQLFSFPCLNTYCLDVMQGQSAEVTAANYVMRYAFAALGSAFCLPAIEKIGVGGFSTISAGFLIVAAGLTWLTTQFGRGWRDAVDERKKERGAEEGRVGTNENDAA
ncbi:Dityrosine transporter 1 [Lasiodiplodia hormozganensis]|uniref:Dityrosine transporter 1 n=1 Tax=Lasiodiplodia hormozganensis TaxID=869390 RepID=A0AA39WV69_9PEZI|nr:Dityrosine transporter 1 [Lasiodiplodia hormozganensis]